MDDAHRIVSSEAEELILVDSDDHETGFLSKALAHDGQGVLHRAFSVFLFNGHGELLLQQRAASKRLWPGFWSNSCCSHPRRGENMAVATERRLADELNVDAELEYVYKFLYRAAYGELGSEYECCHVYLGRCDEVRANEQEISGVRFVGADALEAEFASVRETFTPWFMMEWRALRESHSAALERFL